MACGCCTDKQRLKLSGLVLGSLARLKVFLMHCLRREKQLSSLKLPVHWDKTVIVVMNEVRVSMPYLPENVTGGTPAANDRVKKVVTTF
ncbi:hypothetical protein GW17_00027655 [Ensete ventricosum]|nr:hypothetical protein GW17_00027655 [Ensete ventricosum]RZS07309.1 hypothetical protein BHM03_00038118 [Ensete ventricosum]